MTNFVNPSSDLYKGIRGWEAPPGHTQTLSLPSNWNGRIWPRRDCSFDSNGKGSCLSGNCGSGLDCEDADEGFLSLGEFNLDSWNGQDCRFIFARYLPFAADPTRLSLRLVLRRRLQCPDVHRSGRLPRAQVQRRHQRHLSGQADEAVRLWSLCPQRGGRALG